MQQINDIFPAFITRRFLKIYALLVGISSVSVMVYFTLSTLYSESYILYSENIYKSNFIIDRIGNVTGISKATNSIDYGDSIYYFSTIYGKKGSIHAMGKLIKKSSNWHLIFIKEDIDDFDKISRRKYESNEKQTYK